MWLAFKFFFTWLTFKKIYKKKLFLKSEWNDIVVLNYRYVPGILKTSFLANNFQNVLKKLLVISKSNYLGGTKKCDFGIMHSLIFKITMTKITKYQNMIT